MPQILVFGASITYGAWDRQGGWVQRLRKWIDRANLVDDEFYGLVYNLGISGDTSTELLQRFESEAERRMKEERETIFILSIGGNDAQMLLDKNVPRTPPEQFRNNIEKLLDLARKHSSKIMFVGLTPVDESRTVPTLWNKNIAYLNSNMRHYNEIIKDVCKQQGVMFVDVFELFELVGHKSLLEDGLHPNSKGHRMIFEEVRKALLKSGFVKIKEELRGKLVRDRIPEMLESKGMSPTVRAVSDEKEYMRRLIDKLEEEVEELLESGEAEELVDILEVVYSLAESKGLDHGKLEELRKKKAEERGSFKKALIWDDV